MMNTESVTTPTTNVNKPASTKIGESAEAASFNPHMAAAGHRNGKKRTKLINAISTPTIPKIVCVMVTMLFMVIYLSVL